MAVKPDIMLHQWYFYRMVCKSMPSFQMAMRSVAGLGLILSFLACDHSAEESANKAKEKHDWPLASYEDTTILDMHEGNHLAWRLITTSLVKWPKSDLIKARPVNLLVYDSLGKEVIHVTSDSGSVDESVNFLMATGHVHGVSNKGLDLRTDSLRWNKSANQVHTEARVKVISEEGDTLSGKGFVSDAKLDNWKILSQVRAVFTQVEKRAKNIDNNSSSTGNAGGDSSTPSQTPIAPPVSPPAGPLTEPPPFQEEP